MRDDATRTGRGLDRVVNFTDAAVAIAITLLVLPLVDLAATDDVGSVREVLVDHRSSFVAFAVTFAVIGRFWVIHHRLFEALQTYTPAVLVVNLVWIAAIVFFPFAAQLVADLSDDDPTAVVVYIGVMVVASGCLATTSAIVVRNLDLQRPDVRGTIRVRDSLVPMGLLVVALVLAAVFPAGGLLWLLVLLLAGPVGALVDRALGR